MTEIVRQLEQDIGKSLEGQSGSGLFCNNLFCTNASTTADMPDIDELLEIMRDFHEKHPRRDKDVDVFVMTDEHCRALKEQCLEGRQIDIEAHLGYPWALAGIPIESYPTSWECWDRAMKLTERKVRVGLVF